MAKVILRTYIANVRK